MSRPVKGPWGPWATAGFATLIALVFTAAQLLLAIPYVLVKVAAAPNTNIETAAAALESDGLFVALAELVAGSVALGFTLLIVWLRRGPRIREYLALHAPARPTMLRWLLAAVVLALVLDVAAWLSGYPTVPEWVQGVYRNAGSLPLLLIAFVVVAPVLEEVMFRGFFFEGLRRSRLGEAGTIVLASLIWACVHVQYQWFYIGQVFAIGLLLGAARSRTASLVPPIAMHALQNAIGTLQAGLESWR